MQNHKLWHVKSVEIYISLCICTEHGLVNKVFLIRAGSSGFDSHQQHMSQWFFRSSRPRYPHPVFSGTSDIRVPVGDCNVTKGWPWCLPYQTGKSVHVPQNKGQTQGTGVHGHGFIPLSHSGNIFRGIGTYLPTCICTVWSECFLIASTACVFLGFCKLKNQTQSM